MEAEYFKKLQEKAQGLKVAIKKAGKFLNPAQLNKAVQEAEAKLEKTKAQKLEEKRLEDEKNKIAELKKVAGDNEKTIKVVKPLAGKYLLSHTVGEIVNMESKQAGEICEDGYAKEV